MSKEPNGTARMSEELQIIDKKLDALQLQIKDVEYQGKDIQRMDSKVESLADSVQKVEHQLGRLVSHVESEMGIRKHHAERIEMVIEKMDAVLSGKDSQPGLVIKLDRLEQSEKARNRWIGIIGTAVVALIGETIFEVLSR